MAPAALYPDAAALQPVMDAFLGGVAADAAQFAGAVMVRRIVGIARLLDFESIKDVALKCAWMTRALGRAACTARAWHHPPVTAQGASPWLPCCALFG